MTKVKGRVFTGAIIAIIYALTILTIWLINCRINYIEKLGGQQAIAINI